MTSASVLTLVAQVPPQHAVLLACALFAIGILGVTCRRNVLVVLLSVEILLNAANLAFVAFSKVHGEITGQVFVFFSMTVAAAEVAVGLAIVIALYRLRRTTDVGRVTDLKEVDYGPPPPLKLEGEDAHHAAHDDAHEETHAAPEAEHAGAGGHHDAHGGAHGASHGGGGH